MEAKKSSAAKKLVVMLLVAGIGGAAGFVARPRLAPDERIAALEQAAADATSAAATQKDIATKLGNDLEVTSAAKRDAEAKLAEAQHETTQLADKAADAERKAKDAELLQQKLKAAIDKSSGSVSQEGDEIHLQLLDKVLFKTGDDQLTDRGKQVIDRVAAAAIGDLPDKQIWVQGHTDDQPIVILPPSKKPAKPSPTVATARFATNWELSAARALNVVHYLQDVAKIDPTRLAALAFGQYRPTSRSNKAANRRIEIVLYPKHAIINK